MIWKDGYFRNPDGTRYIPLGQFGGYFFASYIGDEVKTDSHNSNKMLEFQKMPRSIWRKYFRYLSEEVGSTAIRLFPRGDSNGAAWEGLDIGGRVNLELLEKMKWYLRDAREYGIKLCLVIPYMTKDINDNGDYYYSLYDDIIRPEELMGVHFKAAITKRNRWMVENSAYAICFVRDTVGGAYKTLTYAQKTDIKIFNLGVEQ